MLLLLIPLLHLLNYLHAVLIVDLVVIIIFINKRLECDLDLNSLSI